jgi:hypothetical protein
VERLRVAVRPELGVGRHRYLRNRHGCAPASSARRPRTDGPKRADAGTISYFRNGRALGVAFDRIRDGQGSLALFPAFSLSLGERCQLNFGAAPLRYPVDQYEPLHLVPSRAPAVRFLLQCLDRLLPSEFKMAGRLPVRAAAPRPRPR